MNWNQYQELFPSRYIKHGVFDQYVLSALDTHKPQSILDVGCGIHGTKVLSQHKNVFYFDPYIDEGPSWAKRVEDGFTQKFDLIVCRGSVNYLKPDEICNLYDEHLNSQGHFLANTFSSPPDESLSRPYQTIAGIEGKESSEYDPESKMIHHTICINGEEIKHDFYYHDERVLAHCFNGHMSYIKHGKNSVIVDATKIAGFAPYPAT